MGEKATRYCAGLRSGPAFPVQNSMNNPGELENSKGEDVRCA